MTGFLIRDAIVNDIDILLGFEQKLIDEERIFDKALRQANIFYYDFDEMLGNADVKLLVAEINKEIIGTGYARIKNAEPFLKYSKYALLGFMYVLPKCRGRGINKKIIQKLKQWAISRQVSEIRLDVYRENKAAIKAYMKSGFESHVLEMRLQAHDV